MVKQIGSKSELKDTIRKMHRAQQNVKTRRAYCPRARSGVGSTTGCNRTKKEVDAILMDVKRHVMRLEKKKAEQEQAMRLAELDAISRSMQAAPVAGQDHLTNPEAQGSQHHTGEVSTRPAKRCPPTAEWSTHFDLAPHAPMANEAKRIRKNAMHTYQVTRSDHPASHPKILSHTSTVPGAVLQQTTSTLRHESMSEQSERSRIGSSSDSSAHSSSVRSHISATQSPVRPERATVSNHGSSSRSATGSPSRSATGSPSGSATGSPSGSATGSPSGSASGSPSGSAFGSPSGSHKDKAQDMLAPADQDGTYGEGSAVPTPASKTVARLHNQTTLDDESVRILKSNMERYVPTLKARLGDRIAALAPPQTKNTPTPAMDQQLGQDPTGRPSQNPNAQQDRHPAPNMDRQLCQGRPQRDANNSQQNRPPNARDRPTHEQRRTMYRNDDIYREQQGYKISGFMSTRDLMFYDVSGVTARVTAPSPVLDGEIDGHAVLKYDGSGIKRPMIVSGMHNVCWVIGEEEFVVKQLVTAGFKLRVSGRWMRTGLERDPWGNGFLVWESDLKWEVVRDN
ncbi:hypothetical protein BJ508DRAFT_336700 [Ascobolus immersus RN42]|uniref:Uncharacterized protein n=1 Tax=Ascobolus immersus RN42 TaxID=1160509 RepID=A0A3N4HMI1_ASCIM|nr:hypothetical protein BJ508DRAFT_336700 [Ascobolus immersus RN42]